MVKSIAWIVVNGQKKSFNQGYCYTCFQNSPMSSECIIKPELCRAHLGEGRDMEWEREHHLKDHYVYLAVSSGVKVELLEIRRSQLDGLIRVQVTQFQLLEHLIVIYVE